LNNDAAIVSNENVNADAPVYDDIVAIVTTADVGTSFNATDMNEGLASTASAFKLAISAQFSTCV
jgi:hypothetical protein